ncbi:hypothetical protein ACLOAV_005836 [Pseudogymnoascus australis]
MAPSTPKLEERQSQVIAEDCSTSSIDSDFDELFSQHTVHMAGSGDSHWRAADWRSSDDPLRHELSEVGAIEQHQGPAEAVSPNVALEADIKGPWAYVTPETAPQNPADATLPELTAQLAPQAIISEVQLSPVKRKRPTSASSGPTQRSRRKTAVHEYVASASLFTSTALKEIDNLMEAHSKHFEVASKDFEALQHFEDIMCRLTTLRSLIASHEAMEEEAIGERDLSFLLLQSR